MSDWSTGWSAETVTVPASMSTVTACTPGTALTSVVTALRQWSQVMPSTRKVSVPTNVGGVLGVMRFSWVRVVRAVVLSVLVMAGCSRRRNRRVAGALGGTTGGGLFGRDVLRVAGTAVRALSATGGRWTAEFGRAAVRGAVTGRAGDGTCSCVWLVVHVHRGGA